MLEITLNGWVVGCLAAVVSSLSFFFPSSARNVSADWGLVLGVACIDTKSFMESANMGSFDPVEKECKKICPTCAAVDYGNDTSSSKPSWRTLAEVFFAIAIANFLLA